MADSPTNPLNLPPDNGAPFSRDAANSETSLTSIVLAEPQDDNDDLALVLGPVAAALTSATTVSFFSSATFHLLFIGTVAVVAPYLGLDWLKLLDEPQPPLQAALGDEDFLDDLPQFEFVGDLSEQLETPASSIEQLAQQLQRSDSATLLMANDDVLKSIAGSDASDPDASGSGVLLKVPESGLAVTKGSFTAFTIPANPKPREIYSIVIEVRLPDDVKQFRVSDLVGEVRGSDRYVQKLPYDSRTPQASGYPVENQKIKVLTTSTVLDVVDNRVQIIVKVPGAARLVKDVIRIRSKKLKEEQELTLIFGLPSGSSEPAEDDASDTVKPPAP